MEADDDTHGHPECHGESIGTDAEHRAYYVCGDDLRLYRWDKPKGKGGLGFAEPGWGTVCVGLEETSVFVASFEKSGSKKEKELFEYLMGMHMPSHLAAEEKRVRAERAVAARQGLTQIYNITFSVTSSRLFLTTGTHT